MAFRNRRAQTVELGQGTPVLVRNDQTDVLEAVGEELADAGPKRIKSLARARRDVEGTWECVRHPPPPKGIEEVQLVQDELDGHVVRPDLREHGLHGVDRLPEPVLGD